MRTFAYRGWYVAAWSHEVTDTLFSRTLLDVPVLLYRNAAGSVVAMHDVCPHRFAPLSAGQLIGDRLRCGYHGLEFDETGACVGSCLGTKAPKVAKVRTFQVHEQDRLIWIWLAESAVDDPSTIMRFPFLVDEGKRAVFGVQTGGMDYRLISDNLMDLTHAALLHPIFGGLNYQPDFRSWEEGDDVVSEYRSEAPSSMIAGDVPVYVTDTIRWHAPGAHNLLTRIEPKDRTLKAVEFPAAHIVTPESRFSTHYFWAAAIDRESPMTDEQLLASLQQAFDNEDKPMIEAVQKRMGDRELSDMKPLLLATDASAIRVRRKLERLIRLEEADGVELALA